MKLAQYLCCVYFAFFVFLHSSKTTPSIELVKLRFCCIHSSKKTNLSKSSPMTSPLSFCGQLLWNKIFTHLLIKDEMPAANWQIKRVKQDIGKKLIKLINTYHDASFMLIPICFECYICTIKILFLCFCQYVGLSYSVCPYLHEDEVKKRPLLNQENEQSPPIQ